MTIPIRQNTASQKIPLGYLLDSTDGNTEETGLTIANTDIKLWKHDATTLANKNSGGATHISNGIYYCVLDATDSNTLGGLTVFVHVAGALAIKVECVVLTANTFGALVLGTDVLYADLMQIVGLSQSATDLKDFTDTGYDPATHKVHGVVLTDTCTTNTDVRGTDLAALADTALTNATWTDARAGALTDWINGGRLDLILDSIAGDTTTDIPAKLLAYIQLIARSDAAIATDNATELTAINADGGSGAGDFSNQAEALEAIRDRGDAAWTGGGVAPTVGEIRTEMEGAGTKLTLTLGDTDELQGNQGAWATAVGFSTHSAADIWSVATRILTANTNFNDLDAAAVKAEVAAALQDIKLDHLINIAVDTDWATTVHLDSVIGHMADVGTSATFNRTTDALEAIRNHGDSAWVTATGFNTTTPPTVIQIRQEMDSNSTKMAPSQVLAEYKATGFSTHSATNVWSVGTRALTDKSGFALSTAGIKAIWDQLTAALTTIGSIGKLLVDNINATISSRNSTTPPTVGAIRTEMEGAGTKLTEILEDTGTTLDEMIERILGLEQENLFIDNTTYTGVHLTSARIRIYSVAGSVGTASDVIATYTMTASYTGDEMDDYKVVKV